MSDVVRAADLLDPPRNALGGYFDDPARFAQECIIWPPGQGPTDYQLENLTELVEYGSLAERGPHALGKDLCVDTPIPTPDGWTTMGALAAGDVIYDEQGKPCKVLYAEDAEMREAHHVVFADGASIVAGAGHLWNAVDVYSRPKHVTDWREHWGAAKTVETRDIHARLRSPSGQLRWRVPTARPIECAEVDLPIDPYVFGYWLGDGSSSGPRITVSDADAEHLDEQLAVAGYAVGARTRGAGAVATIGLKRPGGGYNNGLTRDLRALGVLGDKHVPTIYLRASVAQRRALVQGLWDSDGYRQAEGCDEITLTNEVLAEGVAELLRTLGLSVRVRESASKYQGREVGRRWRIAARFDFRPYRMRRYKWTARGAQASRHTQRTIVSTAAVGERRTRCIAVDSPSHLFLAGHDFIPTHNSAKNAWVVLWFSLTRDAAAKDWKGASTASSWRQLEMYLWPEIHKWAKRLDWKRLGRPPFIPGIELMKMELRLAHGLFFAAACEDPAKIEGLHADEVCFVYDESKSIPDSTFDATEGAFMGAGDDTAMNAYRIASSTPGEPVGRFFDIHNRKKGLEDWHAKHVTLKDTIKAGRVSARKAEQLKRQWGEDSALYINRVLGNFASREEDGVIPLRWVELANERWVEMEAAGWIDLPPLQAIGGDVATTGKDKTVLAMRHGEVLRELIRLPKQNEMETAGSIKKRLDMAEHHPVAMVDFFAGGVISRLEEQGANVKAFNHSHHDSTMFDISGQIELHNQRAAAWWYLRDLLNPENGHHVALPPDDKLTGDLVTPRWQEHSSGRVKVELKDDVRKRLDGRSTDDGDAVVYAFWTMARQAISVPVFGTKASRYGVFRQRAGGF